ncbi:lysozyme [uncultured Brevundimonas sp.]|uniref:lysozyme n=1 Tax=uncultured Brevundimonas sp. TaxID=213418 RepID=UPI0026100E90|nr:lysozyme [uncultured Brevundimonas sp.]
MSDATTPRLKVSREGVVLIKSFEGFRPRAVRNADGRWVIGYGHTASAREGSTVSEQDAELLLQYDLLPVVKALNERVSAPLNQHQFDALASFAVSVGIDAFLASDVLQRLNDGRAVEAADAMIGWPETTPPDARLRRRAAERALFVADPATPVHLAELLAAPLPPPDEPEPAPAGPPAAAAGPAVVFESRPFQAATITAIRLQRYSPYAAAIIGPLPGFPTAAGPAPSPEPEPEPEPEPQPQPAVDPPAPPAPGASPFPPMEEPLVLTPATEADFAETGRAVWEPDRRPQAAPAEADAVLFDEEPTLSVLRHEVETPAPRRFDWSVTGAFIVMGLTGLAACAAAAAAFRKAMADGSQLNDYTVIGWVLALIGVICVGVASWNLFVQWSRRT